MSQLTWNKVLRSQCIVLILLTFTEFLVMSDFRKFMSNYFFYLVLLSPHLVYLSYMDIKNTSRKIGLAVTPAIKQKYTYILGFPTLLLLAYISTKPYGHDLLLFLNTVSLLVVVSLMSFSLIYKNKKIAS